MIKARNKTTALKTKCTDNDVHQASGQMMDRLNGERISEYVNERKSKLNVQYLLHNVAKELVQQKRMKRTQKVIWLQFPRHEHKIFHILSKVSNGIETAAPATSAALAAPAV